MSTVKAVRGTRDLYPPETELWNRVEATARSVFSRYHFGEIRTPIFEATELFARGVGEQTDIVSKEMYTWEDGERFNIEALKDAWWRSDVSYDDREYDIRGDEHGVNARTILDDSAELLMFRERLDSRDIDQLRLAIANAAASPRSLGFHTSRVSGRIVVASRIPGKAEEDRGGVKITYLHGNFAKDGHSLTLRPENTAGVVRAYIEHKLGETGLLQKLYYIGPQFRRERPQRGRYRQFFQIGAEVLGPVSAGSESPLRDAEVIEMLATLLGELGLEPASGAGTGWRLAINSVGSMQDRPRYIAALREALAAVANNLCGDCQQRAHTNPLRVLDCKVPEDQPFINALPQIDEFLDDDSKAHFAAVCAALDACGVPYTVTPRLVRGIDYYTRTTFEFTHDAGLGSQNALLGGGRYDGLSEQLGGPKAPGIGFAIGADRLVLTLQTIAGETQTAKADAMIAPIGEAQGPAALALAKGLRAAGLRVELGDGLWRLKKSFETADKLAHAIVLVGEDEVANGFYTVKEFATGEQRKVSYAELASQLAVPDTLG